MHDTELYQQYLNLLFHGVKLPPHTHENAKISETYGEVLYASVNKLIASISFKGTDVFYDLGSGVGKLAIQFFLKTNIRLVQGIELCHDLHLIASSAEKRMQTELPFYYENNRKIILIHGDFLKTNFANATILLIASPCFSMSMFATLAQRINRLENIRYVLSLKPMIDLKNFYLRRTLRLECTWDSALCYVYEKCVAF